MGLKNIFTRNKRDGSAPSPHQEHAVSRETDESSGVDSDAESANLASSLSLATSGSRGSRGGSPTSSSTNSPLASPVSPQLRPINATNLKPLEESPCEINGENSAATHSLMGIASSMKMRSTNTLSQSQTSLATSNNQEPHQAAPPLSRENSHASSHASSTHGAAAKRVVCYENGSHQHYLRNAHRQEKLSRMLREIMGTGSKVGNDAVSAVPDFVRNSQSENKAGLSLMHGLVNKVAKGELELDYVSGASFKGSKPADFYPNANGRDGKKLDGKQSSLKAPGVQSMAQKYGKCSEIIGKGSYGTVRVSHKIVKGKEQLFAVKEFRKRSAESDSKFQDRLMSEFCISSSLHHPNIIETLDLMKDTQGGCCQVMEYCSGGDLYSLVISTGSHGLTACEADCFFKQILRGVVYMHSMGVAHCDLKPENIILTRDGVCKISDFGNGECFRMAWEDTIHFSKGICGSGPYIAPEQFKEKPFDPRSVDIWAMGIIYMVMRTGNYLWRQAVSDEDEYYEQYLIDRKTSRGYAPIEKLARSKCVYVIYSVLDPVPSRRITGKQVLNSEWVRSIRVCDAAEVKHQKLAAATAAVPESQNMVELAKVNVKA